MVGKTCPNMKLTPPYRSLPQYSTTKHLGNIRLHVALTLELVYSLKKFFEQTK